MPLLMKNVSLSLWVHIEKCRLFVNEQRTPKKNNISDGKILLTTNSKKNLFYLFMFVTFKVTKSNLTFECKFSKFVSFKKKVVLSPCSLDNRCFWGNIEHM